MPKSIGAGQSNGYTSTPRNDGKDHHVKDRQFLKEQKLQVTKDLLSKYRMTVQIISLLTGIKEVKKTFERNSQNFRELTLSPIF